MRRGRFITLEGGEGVGKSTLAAGLARALTERGIGVRLTREPGGTPAGDTLRSLVLDPPAGVAWGHVAETLLFYAARAEHVRLLIEPSLAAGDWVICDRFSDSTRAYQGARGGAAPDLLAALEAACVGTNRPDLTLLLDASPTVSRDRLAARGAAPDAIEQRTADYHDRVRRGFLEIAARAPERVAVIDAGQPREQVLADALAAIASRLPDAPPAGEPT